MTDETLFNDGGTTPPANEQASAPTIALPDNVKDLVGPGKKYATVEKALEALGHSQTHIATLQEEARVLREKAEAAVSNDEVYATVQELLKAERATHPAATLDEAAIASLLDRKLTERETVQIQAHNADTVREALVKKFGTKEKAQEVFDAKAKEYGVGVGFLTDLAKKSPKAALDLFGIKNESAPMAPAVRGSVNTEQLSQTASTPQPKRIMGGASSADIMAAWRAAATPKSS